MKISNSTGKSKDFYNKGKEMFDRIQPLPMRKAVTEEDDDIQDYKKPWVGLTNDEKEILSYQAEGNTWTAVELAEAKLKEKNI